MLKKKSQSVTAAVAESPAPQPAPWPPADVSAKLASLAQRVKDAHADIAKAKERRANVHAAKAVLELAGNFHEVLKDAEAGVRAAEASWHVARQSLREYAEKELRAGKTLVSDTFAGIAVHLEEKKRDAAEAAAKLLEIFDSLEIHSEQTKSAIANCDRAAADWNAALEGVPELASFRLSHSLHENVKQVFRHTPALRFFFDARAEFHAKLDAVKERDKEFAAATRR